MKLQRLAGPSDAWVVIPARGGSVGIPRKNLRLLGGIPLIAHTIQTATSILPAERVVVITDDVEIAEVSGSWGASVILEKVPTPPQETLDTKLLRNLPLLRERGATDNDIIVTVQPTSPLLKPSTLREGISRVASADIGSVVSVADDRHLRWRLNSNGEILPAFEERVNRQQLPPEYRETGGIIGARLRSIETHGTRVVSPVSILPVGDEEAVDIDSYADLYAAAHLLSRKKIAIRVDASKALGMGHVYRALALCTELARHDIRVFLSAGLHLGQQFFDQYPYRHESVTSHEEFCLRLQDWQPDLIVFDVLDTTAETVSSARRAAPHSKIVTFEDRGPGASEADLLVAEFVHNAEVPESDQLTGVDYALLSPSFELGRPSEAIAKAEVSNVLVLFGGTDPGHLAERALTSLDRVGYDGSVTVVRGLGAGPIETPSKQWSFELEMFEDVKHMPGLMRRADLAFTSAGRTIVELMSCGVPSICLAQNEKELTHTHATRDNGVLALGLGSLVPDDELDTATSTILTDRGIREELTALARRAGERRRNQNTISAILTRVGFEDFPDI